ncbi:MAG: hypothetical protein H7249_20255 [Chitinophagaceae bacterium]|nr:hypothetical protein [Oligoflexus sp.]
MIEKMVSFREFLQDRLRPLTENLSHVMHNVDFLSEIVLLLANYQEEGTNLFPVVFITDSKDHLSKHLAAREMIAIGEGPINRDTFTRAFKHCAPLAEDRLWAVYILMEGSTVRYGIFRSESSPLAPTVFEKIRNLREEGSCIIGLTRLGGNFVEIRTSTGLHQYVNVTGTDEDDYHPGRVIRDFVACVSSGAEGPVKPLLSSFYYRVGMDVMHGSHGSLIGILKKGQSIPDILEDGIHLKPSINVSEAIRGIIQSEDRDNYLRLMSYSLLLRKLTWMDGITLLDTEGGILAYNCFIKTSALRPQDAIIGGARRRAFEHMQNNVPGLLAGCLYKSQDGHIEFKGEKSGVAVS